MTGRFPGRLIPDGLDGTEQAGSESRSAVGQPGIAAASLEKARAGLNGLVGTDDRTAP